MLRRFSLILITVLACSASLQAKPKQEYFHAHSFESAYEKVLEVAKGMSPEDVLVAVDIDNTLTEPDHPALSYWAIMQHFKVFKELVYSLKPAQRDYLFRMTTVERPQRLLEKDSPKYVKKLQASGYKVIAFTASLSGAFTDTKTKAIFKRRDMLLSKGFNFSKSLKEYTTVITWVDYPKYHEGYPMYYHGVLCSNGVYGPESGKGNVMVSLLKDIGANRLQKAGSGYFPKLVILIDDRHKNIVDVDERLNDFDPTLKFFGISFKGALVHPKSKIGEKDFRSYWEKLVAQVRKAQI